MKIAAAAIMLLANLLALDVSAQLTISHSEPNYGGALKDFQEPPPMQTKTIADPFRVVNDTTNRVTDDWITFQGVVQQVHPKEGVRITGYFTGQQTPGSDFFVVNFPYVAAEGDQIGGRNLIYKAVDAGTYTYSTASGSTRTIHKLDYGTVWTPPPLTPEQIEAERQLAAKKKVASNAATLKFNEQQADAGDPYGQLRMAERYRDGDGVETNLYKAKFLFMAAADQGNETAAKELFALTNTPAK